jgi:CBS domain-containing protein
MRVKELMTKDVVTVGAEANLQDVARRMKKHDVGFMPVVEAEKVVAIVTDRDLVTRGAAEGRAPESTPVREVAIRKVWTVYEDDSLADLAHTMKEKGVRRFVVLDREERPIGVVSVADIACRGGGEIAGAIMEAVCAPAKPRAIDDRTRARPAFARIVEA